MKLKIIFTLLVLSLCTILSIKAQNCRYCKGTGKMIKEVAISTYGNDVKVWCDICQKSFWRSYGHMHVQCKYCRGTGRGQSYSSSSNSTNRDSKPSDDFLSSNLTSAELEQLRFWSKCLHTGYPYQGACPSCEGSKACNWCKGSGYIRAGFGGRYVQVSCTKCYNGICQNCAGLGTTTQYSKSPEHMKMISDKITELYGIAKSRNRQDSYETTITEKPVKKTNNSFDYDIACRRRLTESDLYGLSKNELRIMRNWIFARHGYIFKTAAMKSYFSQKSWYNGRYNDVYSSLSAVEKYNVEFIKRHE